MANIRSCNKHNMIACVEKTAQNADFYQVIDFLTGCSINYSLLVDPDLIGPWLQQFWATATLQVINDVPHIRAKVAGKKILISEATIRADLLFDDENGVDCFPKQVIWDTLRDIGYEANGPYEEQSTSPILELSSYARISSLRAAHSQSAALSQEKLGTQEHTSFQAKTNTQAQSQAQEIDPICQPVVKYQGSGKTEELDLETTHSTARQGNYYTMNPNFEDEAVPSSPLRPIKIRTQKTTLKLSEVLVSISKTKSLTTPVPYNLILNGQPLKSVDDYYEPYPPSPPSLRFMLLSEQSSTLFTSTASVQQDRDLDEGVGVTSPTSGTSLVGQLRAAYKSVVKGLVGATASIHQLSHATDHSGSEPTLISDRSVDITTQSHNALS
ncbi:hypothetical protein Tco_0916192 [Tanacetum coccineum]